MQRTRRPTLRHLMRLVVSVVIGLAVTISVSWSFALKSDLGARPRFALEKPPRNYISSTFLWTGKVGIEARKGAGYEFYYTLFEPPHPAPRSPSSQARGRSVMDIASPWAIPLIAPWRVDQPWPYKSGRRMQAIAAFGWPYPALRATYTSHRVPGTLNPYRGGIELPGRTVSKCHNLTRMLPYQPVWHGLVINTALASAVVWHLLFMGAAMQRARRSHAGQCPRCAYDLQATPAGLPCPECGTLRSTPRNAQPH